MHLIERMPENLGVDTENLLSLTRQWGTKLIREYTEKLLSVRSNRFYCD